MDPCCSSVLLIPKFNLSPTLIEIEQAWQLIAKQTSTTETESIQLADAAGRILRNPIVSDIDSPPFAKSLMDGFAIGNWNDVNPEYTIVEVITAGQLPTQALSPGQATQIMTGCPVPEGTAGVVMIEQTEAIAEGKIKLTTDAFRAGQNVLDQGHVIQTGECLAQAGHLVQAHDIGTFAEFGFAELEVARRTRVAVLVTGDELVDPAESPGPGQIRNSNGSMLCGLAKAAGGEVTDLGIARDNKEELSQKIEQGLKNDVLVIAGGVSAGVLDLIPQCLAENGVQQVFHKINLKPGKPLWFGKAENGCLVFGLPGNPVSSLVCFKLFAEPTIRNLEQGSREWVDFCSGQLSSEFQFKAGRRTFWPVQIDLSEQGFMLNPLDWKGSADQVTFLKANGLVSLGQENLENGGYSILEAGSAVEFIWL